ncbi:hypothetical protein CYMTET_20595 [Cymbomonas tetramitiformis]|uniref:Uncharacterized protein n=1 Tax=Cymbomonas tetramitiformis TaxID=36881 RepID=A0AAE0G401_9CHLO|nr:hypothetical protein CYMTET_20595 [Cymbomonas tetramitiformis]
MSAPNVSVEVLSNLYHTADNLLTKLHKFHTEFLKDDKGQPTISDKLAEKLLDIFPASPKTVEWRKVDQAGATKLDAFISPGTLQALLPWYDVLEDIATYYKSATTALQTLSRGGISLVMNLNSDVTQLVMGVFMRTLKVMILWNKSPHTLLLQMIQWVSESLTEGKPASWKFIVSFSQYYSDVIPKLQEDYKGFDELLGTVLEEVACPCLKVLSVVDFWRDEEFMSPFFRPSSELPPQATWENLAMLEDYTNWVLLGALICPFELKRKVVKEVTVILLQENFLLSLKHDVCLDLHAEYTLHVQTRSADILKRGQEEAEHSRQPQISFAGPRKTSASVSHYSTNLSRSFVDDAKSSAAGNAATLHQEKAFNLSMDMQRCILFLTEEPGSLQEKMPLMLAIMTLAKQEVLWYFLHVGDIETVPVEEGIAELIGKLVQLVGAVEAYLPYIRRQTQAALQLQARALRSWLTERSTNLIRHDDPDIDPESLNQVSEVVEELEAMLLTFLLNPTNEQSSWRPPHSPHILRSRWMMVIFHLSKRTTSGSLAALQQACIDEGMDIVSVLNSISRMSSLMDRPQVLLREASSLGWVLHFIPKLRGVVNVTLGAAPGICGHSLAVVRVLSLAARDQARLAQQYTGVEYKQGDFLREVELALRGVSERIIELVEQLQGVRGFGRLDMQVEPNQAVARMKGNGGILQVTRRGRTKNVHGVDQTLPGQESKFRNRNQIKDHEEAAAQLVALCAALRDLGAEMEVVPGVLVSPLAPLRNRLREGLTDFVWNKANVPRPTGSTSTSSSSDNILSLTRPSLMEAMFSRWFTVMLIVEEHAGLDAQGLIREVLMDEASTSEEYGGGRGVEAVAQFYIKAVVRDQDGMPLCYSPLQGCFLPTTNQRIALYTCRPELDALLRIFGPQVVETIMLQAVPLLVEGMQYLANMLSEHAETLRRMLGCVAAGDHAGCLAMSGRLTCADTAIIVASQMGRLTALIQLIVASAARVQGVHADALHRFAAMLHQHFARPTMTPEEKKVGRNVRQLQVVVDRCWGGNPEGHMLMVVEEVIYSCFQQVVKDAERIWSLFPVLLGAMLASSQWDKAVYHPETHAFDRNMHCIVEGLMPLLHSILVDEVQHQPKLKHSNMPNPKCGRRFIDDDQSHTMMDIFISVAAALMPSEPRLMKGRAVILERMVTWKGSVRLNRKLLQTHLPFVYGPLLPVPGSASTAALPTPKKNPLQINSPLLVPNK